MSKTQEQSFKRIWSEEGSGVLLKGPLAEALLVINSPIFSLRLVNMTVGASSHFASFVLEQVLDTFSFAGQLHFEIIVHFHHRFGLNTPASLLFLKATLGRQLNYSMHGLANRLVAFPSVALSCLSQASTCSFRVKFFAQ